MANQIRKQSDSAIGGASFIVWCFEQAFPDVITQKVWDMIPFLEIAVVVGAFALGRNWRAVWSWIKSKFDPLGCETRVQDGKLYADLKFKRRCDNPKISVSIHGHAETNLGEACRYALIGRHTIKPKASYNRGESVEVELLSRVPDPLHSRTKPNHVFSNGERYSRQQYRVSLEITHSGWWSFTEKWDVFVPSSTQLEYLIGVIGLPCLEGQPEVSNDKHQHFIETNHD